MLEYKEPGDGCLSSHFMVRVRDELGSGDLGLRPLLLRSSEDKVTDSGSRDEASLVLDSFRLLARLCEKPSPENEEKNERENMILGETDSFSGGSKIFQVADCKPREGKANFGLIVNLS